jgi:dihydroxyacetone kinase/dihydroxyacetone kinase-like protein
MGLVTALAGFIALVGSGLGRGLIDGAAIGNVFASPSSDDMLEVTRAISAGRGVLYLYGNHGRG